MPIKLDEQGRIDWDLFCVDGSSVRAHRTAAGAKSNQDSRPNFDREAYRLHKVIERCVGWLKECRRVATRYEKLAVNYLAMLKLAMSDRYFRMGLSNTAYCTL